MKKESVLLVGALAILLVACDVQEHNLNTVNHKNTALSTWENDDGSSDRKQHSRNMLTKSDEEDASRDKHRVRHHHGAHPSVKPPHTTRKRKGRCRRYSQRYYQVHPNAPVFMPSYDRRYPPPNYPPPQYIVPSRYYPCRSYCVPCVSSTCRRRCPNYPGGSTATATITVTSTAVTKSTKSTAVITVVTDPPCNCDPNGSKSQTCDSSGACACKPNYTGKTCTECRDGRWKNKNNCVECSCNKHGSVPNTHCDKSNGRCRCREGILGAKCDACKSNQYGSVETGCKDCNCDQYGSKRQICDSTGTCVCEPNYTGKTCSSCRDGYWKNKTYCVACGCNKHGSMPNTHCDKWNGKCYCKDGVTGVKCDVCESNQFGTVETGCKTCVCDRDGSTSQKCDSGGACVCKPNYTGKTCTDCKDGYWKNKNNGCVKCSCNKYGSVPNSHCDKSNGKCRCKEGVTGVNCDTCKPHHYGTIEKGCKECDPCTSPGHICDPRNGKCVCPNLTQGDNCKKCADGAWKYEPGIGCKPCECSPTGSLNQKCNPVSGKCNCKTGYEGEKCDRCSFDHYGYPKCRKCNCKPSGTDKGSCQGDKCRCADDGTCQCKENTQGKTCDSCKPKTFGLTKENPKGCTACFCFGRGKSCVNAGLKWDKIREEKADSDTGVIYNDYWKLPKKFMGDLTTSYGGYLTVDMRHSSFTVTLEGNGATLTASATDKHQLQLIESKWDILRINPHFPSDCRSEPTRSCFMTVLQNVTSVLIEANDRIQEVLLDTARSSIPTYSPSYSVERCECPKEYTGLSCQDPNVGYFRYFPNDPKDNWIDFVIGKAKPCECNGKSKQCDPNTGFCTNCTGNTTGKHCELCDTGYYKDAYGNCSPCLCPDASQNNAESCSPIGSSFKCNCKKGYKGQFCDGCNDGYFDKTPRDDSVACEPCGCNPFGVVDGGVGSCNEAGICRCKAGFKGDKCDQCANEREHIKNGVCSPCDACVDLLFSEIDNLTLAVNDTFGLFKDGLKPPWNLLTTTIDKHDMLSEKFKNKKEQTDNLLDKAKLDQLEKKIGYMGEKLKKQNEEANKNIINTDKLQNSSDSLANEINRIKKKLIDTIETLESFATKPVSIKNALKRAREILIEINTISKKFDEQEDQETFDYCTNVTQKVNGIYTPPSIVPWKLLEDLESKLDALTDITASVERTVDKAEKQNLRNGERIGKFKEKIEKLKNNSQNVESSVKEIMSKINATQDLLQQLEVVYNDLRDLIQLVDQTGNRIRRQMEGNPKIKDLFSKAMEHVRELNNKINSYQRLFNFTKDEWKKINASGAYETLLNGIEEARRDVELSKELLLNATKLIYPADSVNTIDKTNLALEYSEKLKQKINNLKNISTSLNDVKHKLDKFKYSIQDSGKANNNLNYILHQMDLDITSQADVVAKLEDAIKNSTVISNDMDKIKKKVQDMLNSSQANFFNKYGAYLNLTSKEETEKLKTKLNETRKYLENIDVTTTYYDSIKKFNNDNKSRNLQAIQKKIEDLTNKIYYAKQAADSINVAMSTSHCHMFYQIPQAEVFQSLSLKYKCENCQLFKLSNAGGEFNLAVENNDVKLKFADKNIAISDTGTDKEKTVNIEKLGPLIKIQVETSEKSELTNAPYYVIYPQDQIEIGNTDNKITNKSYVYNVILNQKKFGLWKFAHTEGNCTGEIRDGSDKQQDNVNTFFNGKGYVMYGKNKLNPLQFTLTFDISTFDESSLIYLATIEENNETSTKDNCAYIMLFLKKGYLNFIVRHSNGLNITLALEDKINNGRKHQIQVDMEYIPQAGLQYYVLQAKNDPFEYKKNTTNTLNKKNVFKIRQALHYVGGVPPIFDKTCLPFNTTSFLGFLELLSVSQLTNMTLSYGTTRTIKQDLEFYQVKLNKNGYVKVKLTEDKIESISFLLRPTSPSGLVMRLGRYNVSLDNDKLLIPELTDDTISLDTNEYNTVNLSLKGGILRVNKIETPIQLLAEINVKDLIMTIGDEYEGFTGGLSNIIINDKELLFTTNTVVDFADAEIGREPPFPNTKRNGKAVKSLPSKFKTANLNIKRCGTVPHHKTIPDAIKFGGTNTTNSYTHIKTNFWKIDYTLGFQFRTFYPNGVIFISADTKKQLHYNVLKLTEGQLGLYIKGKKKSATTLNDKLNDGQWHNVEISKKKQKVTIVLDGKQKRTVKVPKTKVKNEIYFGGIPPHPNYLQITDLGELHSLGGCLRSVVINNEHQLNKTKDVRHSHTGECFSNVEEGAYFNGKAFATFVVEKNLNINKIVELNFDFKTAEQDGILLSVSNYANTSGLSVELQNGAVIMSVNVGSRVVPTVKNNLGSDYALCNNAWHNVTAIYSSSELTVFVDGVSQTWAQSVVNSLLDEINAPIYIGGFPDNASLNAGKSKPNFKGCLKNLRIENELIDWSNMRELNSVLLNSCPN